MYILDTDICSYILKKRPPEVAVKFDEVAAEKLCISSITAAELYYGAEKKGSPKLSRLVRGFVEKMRVLPWGGKVELTYAKLRCELEQNGAPIGNMDMLIAAHALAECAILVTNNTRHFRNVNKLELENWIK